MVEKREKLVAVRIDKLTIVSGIDTRSSVMKIIKMVVQYSLLLALPLKHAYFSAVHKDL